MASCSSTCPNSFDEVARRIENFDFESALDILGTLPIGFEWPTVTCCDLPTNAG